MVFHVRELLIKQRTRAINATCGKLASGVIRMAISVAELARAGTTPRWVSRVVPRCVPVKIKCNQHGERATTIVAGTEGHLY